MSENTKPERQSWSSQLTYILTVAGATVGFGATWRFPYLVDTIRHNKFYFINVSKLNAVCFCKTA
ncbi:hypothetical protein Q7306_04630, partial [Glaesserella parasuis]|nr:hypothetical protein [Glaesserella parasuis]MDP0066734.1 hypothetical protein [Glaesserella parasuis]MDP0232162.1 hypothetical protein [Glaesserella parasuis]MDP0240688.1 hypothetical protein [Glaesserella parasuis]MDP0321924.1 hypothetical protein [Glaesserella parasuis]